MIHGMHSMYGYLIFWSARWCVACVNTQSWQLTDETLHVMWRAYDHSIFRSPGMHVRIIKTCPTKLLQSKVVGTLPFGFVFYVCCCYFVVFFYAALADDRSLELTLSGFDPFSKNAVFILFCWIALVIFCLKFMVWADFSLIYI